VAALYGRWRHLFVLLALYIVVDFLDTILAVHRPVPEGVTVLSSNATTTFPSLPVAALAVTLFGAAMVLAPTGRPRRLARAGALALTGLVVLARLLLACGLPGRRGVLPAARVDHRWGSRSRSSSRRTSFPSPMPAEASPRIWISVARGARPSSRAVRDQLGFTVTEIEPFGLAGSGGSSPLRMRVAEIDGYLFGKIYSTSHLRADRWYKVGRSILYGQLEDEVPLGSVRRLALYEDYALRLLRDVGIGVATTYGIVELTPDREYMLVTEFFSNATTLGDAEVDDAIIDEGMELVQTLWASGLAHRDLKPANMLVRGGHLQLVDVSGLQVRPTPWRPGRRPGEHDADAGAAKRPRSRVRARDHVLLSRRRRRGLRRRPRARDPDAGEREAEGGRPADPRALPRARARSPTGLDPGVERSTRRAHGGAVVGALALAAMVWATLAIGLD
jgi:hypothetical protein